MCRFGPPAAAFASLVRGIPPTDEAAATAGVYAPSLHGEDA
jgi:hypothetical protein